MRSLFLLIASLLLGIVSYAGSNHRAEYNREASPDAFQPQVIFYTISGFVYSDSVGGTPFEGVAVEFSGGIGTVFTDNQGFYSTQIPRGWTGFAQPSYCSNGYSFTPVNYFYSNVKKDYIDQNYVGEPAIMYTITGRIEDAQTGEPIKYEIIDFDNGMQAVTNSLGYYTLDVEPCWSDTLRPLSDDYNFDPEYRVYTQVTEDYNNQDYAATAATFELPPGWDYINTGTVHIISVFTSANPNVCGVPLQEGDWIGAFYLGDDGQYHCGGAGMWTGNENTPVVVQGDDNYTAVKDGFAWGEIMNWRVYTWTSTEEEYPADPEFQVGGFLTYNNKWYPGGLSIIEELDAFHGQKLEIPAGWSGISSHLIPNTSSITNLMSPIIDDLVILQTLTKMYFPSMGINTIGMWNSHQGYKIKVSEATALPLLGCPDANKTVSLPTTWSIFPVLSSCNVQTSEVFGSITDDLIVIKEIAGVNIYWPAMGIYTLSVLEAGKAYMVAVNSSTSVTFPACNNMKAGIESNNVSFVNNSPWEMPELTATSHTIALKEESLAGLVAGDYVGAFTTGGECAGIAMVGQPGKAVALNVFGDDVATPEIEGFNEGDLMTFRIYKAASGEIIDAEVTFDPAMQSADGIFTDNGLSAISQLKASATGMADDYAGNVSFYPNPANGLVTFNSTNASEYLVRITDITGQEVMSLDFSGTRQIDLTTLRKGIYFVKITGENYNKTGKLILK